MTAQQTGKPSETPKMRRFPAWLRFVFIGLGLICLGILAFIWIRGVSSDLDKEMAAIFASLSAIFAFLAMPILYHSEHSHENKGGKLEITDIGFSGQAELDVKVRNLSDNAVIINQISVSIVKDYHVVILPILRPTARYKIPIGDLSEGQSRSINVSHAVDAHKADRFLVALDTTRELKVRLTLHCNKDDKVSYDKDIWRFR